MNAVGINTIIQDTVTHMASNLFGILINHKVTVPDSLRNCQAVFHHCCTIWSPSGSNFNTSQRAVSFLVLLLLQSFLEDMKYYQ